MKKRQFTAFALPALYGMLILAMLILTAAAARCYTRVLERRDENTRQRSALSFIQTQAAASGGTGTVVLRDGPEGVAVCFGEPDHAYETRVYLYNGSLCTEFSRARTAMRTRSSMGIQIFLFIIRAFLCASGPPRSKPVYNAEQRQHDAQQRKADRHREKGDQHRLDAVDHAAERVLRLLRQMAGY